MESYTTRTPTRKLKDTCDLCSASKLRCDKQKPTCARCASLNQPCSYSPARRSGRPHRVRRERGQNRGQAPDPRRNFDQPSVMDLDNGTAFGMQTKSHRQNSHQQPQPQVAESLACAASDLVTGEGDCTRTALSVLAQLNMARRGHGLTHASSTTTNACQRLLAIFICPCSETPRVALLLASGCISLLDTVHHLANGHFHYPGGVGPDIPSTSTTTSPVVEQATSIWSIPSSSRRLSNNSQCGVEELSKIAKVILQFTDKYSQESKGAAGWPHTTWLVAPIVPLLRFRLQSVTREAAKRLVF